MKIVYTQHLKDQLVVRNFPYDYPKRIYLDPEENYKWKVDKCMTKIKKKYYDPESDIFWIIFDVGEIVRYAEPAPGVRVEYGKNSEIIGFEIENFSRLYNYKSTSELRNNSYQYIRIGSDKNIPPNYKTNFLTA